MISIHAPAWGATRKRQDTAKRAANFNPRSRMGSDLIRLQPLVIRVGISIHAPAWGATSGLTWTIGLNPFQYTLPHGERPAPRSGCPPCSGYFNPRSRMGSDIIVPVGALGLP